MGVKAERGAWHEGSEPRRAWRAVLDRDRRWDGRLVYAVRTTGVYCRPSCPSRRPTRANVLFFATPDQAEAAGFRACRRCRPRERAATAGELAVERARAYLEAHLDAPVSLDRLAQEVGVSPFHLQRIFTRIVGVSPKVYVDARRFDRFKAELRRGRTVSRATYEAGFGSASAIYARAAHALGMTPAMYRRGGRGVHIGYTMVSSPFGRLLVAATGRGVAMVALGDDDRSLAGALRAEYPEATLLPEPQIGTGELDPGRTLRHAVEAILAYLRGEVGTPATPIDVPGTPFQRRVWGALQDISPGTTLTYRDVARAIAQPSAVRAVARACATNPVALIVPCHRVVRTDGQLASYRWGVKRKEALLAREARVRH